MAAFEQLQGYFNGRKNLPDYFTNDARVKELINACLKEREKEAFVSGKDYVCERVHHPARGINLEEYQQSKQYLK